jgi:hypothetical protein
MRARPRVTQAGRHRRIRPPGPSYTCSTKTRQGDTDCRGGTVPMKKLDTLVADHIEHRLLQPSRLQ